MSERSLHISLLAPENLNWQMCRTQDSRWQSGVSLGLSLAGRVRGSCQLVLPQPASRNEFFLGLPRPYVSQRLKIRVAHEKTVLPDYLLRVSCLSLILIRLIKHWFPNDSVKCHVSRSYFLSISFQKNSAMSKVILVTGNKTGVGRELVGLLAKEGDTVYLRVEEDDPVRAMWV